MLEGEPSTLKFTYIATITPNEFKPMLAMHNMTQHHDQTPSVHCFGPKDFTKWKIKKKIDAIGWTKRAEVYFYSLCREHPTKWSLCFKNHACYAWYDSTSYSDLLSPLFWSQRFHQVKNLKKIDARAYVVNIPPMKFVLQININKSRSLLHISILHSKMI